MKTIWTGGLLALALMLGAAQAQAGIADTIRATLAKGADPNGWVKQELGFRTHPLHMVAAVNANTPERVKDQLEAMRLLVEAGADVNGQDDLGNTPLHKAVSALNLKAAKWLIRHGADVNARNKEDASPIFELDTAASFINGKRASDDQRKKLGADMRVMAVLLHHHGAKLGLKNSEGRTPLLALAGAAPAPVLEELLLAGADPNVRDRKGNTPLSEAVRWNRDAQSVRVLLRHGAKADAGLLMYAIENDRTDQALALIHSGMDVNRADKSGDTPLAAAVVRTVAVQGDIEPRLRLIRALLDAGADPESKYGLGGTAIGMARQDKRVLALFMEMGEKRVARGRDGRSRRARAGRNGRKGAKGKSPFEIGALAAQRKFSDLLDAATKLEKPALDAANVRGLFGVETIPDHIRRLDRFSRASKRLAEFMRHGDEFAWQRAKDAGATDEEADAAARVFHKAVIESPAVRAVADRARANAEWADLTIRTYRLLQDNPDKWKPPRRGEKYLNVADEAFARKLRELDHRRKEAARKADEAFERYRAARAGKEGGGS